MKSRCVAVSAALAAAFLATSAQADTYPRQTNIDALHYVFRLTLTDGSNEITGQATVRVRFLADGVKEVFLDLASAADGKGMTVSAISNDGQPLTFRHGDNRLQLSLASSPRSGQELSFTIEYHGVPADGLRLIPNIYGDRTMFSENWPDRARQWLPMIDHPYDKATGEFIVTAPAHYQVVANGLLVEELDLENGQRRTHWKQSVPISHCSTSNISTDATVLFKVSSKAARRSFSSSNECPAHQSFTGICPI